MRKLLVWVVVCSSVVVVFSVAALVGLNLLEPSQSNTATEGSPSVTAAPRATPSASVTPTPTAVATPTPAPETPAEPWRYEAASLTIPRIGMVDHPITEYTAEDLARNTATVYNASNESVQVVGVNPPGKQTLSWWSGAQSAGAILSREAIATVSVYAHAYQDGTAIGNGFAKLEIGDLVVVTNYKAGDVDEVLTYEVVEEIRLYKGDVLKSDLQKPVAGRLILWACYSEGQRDNTGHALEADGTILQLKSEVSPNGL